MLYLTTVRFNCQVVILIVAKVKSKLRVINFLQKNLLYFAIDEDIIKTKERSVKAMMYPYMTLFDETEIVHSQIIEENNVQKVIVHFERPTEDELFFSESNFFMQFAFCLTFI